MAGKSEPLDPLSSVSLTLDATVENAAVARRAVAGEARRAGLAEPVTAAAQVVVTESFTNAARHAYSAGPGRVRIHAHADDEGITVAVRDQGDGIRPHPREPGRIGGLGLLLIAALARRVQLRRLPGGGTEVRARVETDGRGSRTGDVAPQAG